MQWGHLWCTSMQLSMQHGMRQHPQKQLETEYITHTHNSNKALLSDFKVKACFSTWLFFSVMPLYARFEPNVICRSFNLSPFCSISCSTNNIDTTYWFNIFCLKAQKDNGISQSTVYTFFNNFTYHKQTCMKLNIFTLVVIVYFKIDTRHKQSKHFTYKKLFTLVFVGFSAELTNPRTS